MIKIAENEKRKKTTYPFYFAIVQFPRLVDFPPRWPVVNYQWAQCAISWQISRDVRHRPRLVVSTSSQLLVWPPSIIVHLEMKWKEKNGEGERERKINSVECWIVRQLVSLWLLSTGSTDGLGWTWLDCIACLVSYR